MLALPRVHPPARRPASRTPTWRTTAGSRT